MKTYNAAQAFSIARNPNPNEPWSYLAVRSAGSAPEKLDRSANGSMGGSHAPVSYWNFANATGAAVYQAVFANSSTAPIQAGEGLRLAPGALVLHPGSGPDLATVLRFTAPVAGDYQVDATFTKADEQPGSVEVAVQKGGASLMSGAFGRAGETGSFHQKVTLGASEAIDFVVTSGHDGFANDAVQVTATVTHLPYDAAKAFSIAANPGRPWSYLAVRSAGKAPEKLDRSGTGNMGSSYDPVSYWNLATATGSAVYQAVFSNSSKAPVQMGEGLRLAPGALVLHPGNGPGLATVLRFTAPMAGDYEVNATFTKIDEQAGNVQVAVQKGGASLMSSAFRRVWQTDYFHRTVALGASEAIDFVVTCGDDGFADDAVQVSATVTLTDPGAPVPAPGPKTKLIYSKVPNTAMYKHADWAGPVQRIVGQTGDLDPAKAVAARDAQASFFFHMRQPMTLETKGSFAPGDSVLFSGLPWYGSAPQADTYLVAEVYDTSDPTTRAYLQGKIDSIRIADLIDTKGTTASPKKAKGGFYFVDFDDAVGPSGDRAPLALYDGLTGLNTATGVRQLSQWMIDESRGRFSLELVAPSDNRWIRLPGSQTYYKGRADRLIEELDKLVEVPDDWQVVYIVLPPGPESLVWSRLIGCGWDRKPSGAEQPTRTVIIDRIGTPVAADEPLPRLPLHETGHALGLPDLYDDYASYCWSMMSRKDQAWHLLGWEKLLLGWLDLDDYLFVKRGIVDTRVHEQSAPTGHLKGVVFLPDEMRSEAYVVEMAQEMGRTELDRAAFDRWGLLFLRVELRQGWGTIRPVVYKRSDGRYDEASFASYPGGVPFGCNGVHSSHHSSVLVENGVRYIQTTVGTDTQFSYPSWAVSLREGARLRTAEDPAREFHLEINGTPRFGLRSADKTDDTPWLTEKSLQGKAHGFFLYVDETGRLTLTAGTSRTDFTVEIGTISPPSPLPRGSYFLKVEADYQTTSLAVYPGTGPAATGPRAYVALWTRAAVRAGWTQATRNFRATWQLDGNFIVTKKDGAFQWGLTYPKPPAGRDFVVHSAWFTEEGQIVFARDGAEKARFGPAGSAVDGPCFLALVETDGKWELAVFQGTGLQDPAKRRLYAVAP